MPPAPPENSLGLRLFRDAFNASPIGIAVENLDGQLLFVNSAFCRFLGFTEEELQRKLCVDFSPKEDAEKDSALFQQLRAGSIDQYQLEKRYFRRDGSLVWGSLSIWRLNSGPPPLVIAMVEDISERKRTQEALRESEQLLRLATKSGRMYAYDWDIERDEVVRSSEHVQLLALAEPLRFPHQQFVNKIHPDDRPKFLAAIAGLTPANPSGEVSYRVPAPDGTVIWLKSNGCGFFDNQGRLLRVIGMVADITDQKRAEEALRASEERLRLSQQAARIGTFEWNVQTGVNTWTRELEEMYGLPAGGFGGTQTAFENLVYPGDRAAVIALNNSALKTGLPMQGEWRVVWPDGSVHWITGRWQVFMNESGEPSRMVGINIDITDRKRAEQELREANERLHLAIEAGSAGGWDFDLRTGKNVWFGKAHAQLGMAQDETLGSVAEFWARVHENDRARLERALQISNQKHEEFAEDFRVVWRDGTTHWLRSRGRHYYSATGQPERMLGICIDITESKEAEQALRDSERRFHLAAQTGKMYSFEWDVPTDVVMRSPERARVLGGTEPLCFSHQQFVETIHPDDRQKFIATTAGLTPENPTAEVLYRVRGPEGDFVWLKSSGHAFFDSQGKMLRVIGMVADITDLKRTEEELSEMSRRLIQAQEQERARIGRELHDDISQRLAMLSVELERLEDSRSEVHSHVKELRKELRQISDDVQAISHDLHSSKLEYLGVVAGIKSWCKEFAERQRTEIDFKSDVPTAVPLEIGISLFRVLQEALNNAIKHGEVKRIEVQLREDSGEIHLVVRDSGKGFDVETALLGKGLGLTSMRERVRLVNGTVAIDSQPKAGTTVYVRVPLRSQKFSARLAS